MSSIRNRTSRMTVKIFCFLFFSRMEAHLFHCGFSHHIVPGKDIYARSAVPRNPNQEPLFDQKEVYRNNIILMEDYFIQDNSLASSSKRFIDLPGHRGHMVKGYISHRPTAGIEEGPDDILIQYLSDSWLKVSSHLFSECGGKTPTADPESEKQLHLDITRNLL